jgi:hypothetical protein
MNGEPSKPTPPERPPSAATRQLSFPSRVRRCLRRVADRCLGSDRAWSLLFVGVTLVLLSHPRCGVSYDRFTEGQIALHTVRTRSDVDVPDAVLTAERRQHVQEGVPDVYVHDTTRGARVERELAALFERGRAQLEATGAPAALELDDAGEGEVRVLAKHRFSAALQRELGTILRRAMMARIVGNRTLLEHEPEIVIVQVPGHHSERLSTYESILDLDGARDRIRAELGRSPAIPDEDRAALAELLASFVDTNLALDPEQTDRRRQEVAAAVPPVLVRVPRGTVLIRQGERVTADAVARLEAARLGAKGRPGLLELVSLGLVSSLLGFFLFRYASYHQRHFKKVKHLHALLVLVQLCTLLLAQALIWVAGKVVLGLPGPLNDVQLYPYTVPLGAGSVMVALLANGRIAMVSSAFTATLFGAANGWDPFLMTWALLVQCAGVYAISTYRERAALLRAGLVVGIVGSVAALALETLRGALDPWPAGVLMALLTFAGGAVGVGLVVSFALPLLETLFHVLTDVRLLELSNLNTPLLSELALRAPGSYNHSLVVGTLAEEAAKAIGANSLFCRVAGFYHDIGKMLKPEYYVENQRDANPHDKLSPSMSALVVMAHVKDGIRLAREARLPEQIVDIIPQHHGTRLMTYFYEKARKLAEPGAGPVREEEFRYPGPRPQTREAAIFMLADAVEAAARTIDDPSPNRLREVIRKVTHAIVLDGQLVECDLTFVDLDRIQEAFLRFLVSMHHQRVDYPGFEFGRRDRGATAAHPLRGRRAWRGA